MEIIKFYGYHKNCGGSIRNVKSKSSRFGFYIKCNKCQRPIHQADEITQEKQEFKIQKTCGIKKKRKRYDISRWSEVK